MGVSYPASVDTFPVPNLPESTSLSSAGSSNRDHTDSHRDLGLGLTAVMTYAALKTHGHTGSDGTAKLVQANTHQSADTDSSPTALHHTLDPTLVSANKAAPANHDHNIDVVWKKVLSSARPGSPDIGDHIFETNTNRIRAWCQLPDAVAPSWRLVPSSPVLPICRLRQTVAQQLAHNGSIVEFNTATEDNFGYWSSAVKTDVVVKEAGLYQIEASLQWNQHDFVPDTGNIILCINGVETSVRNQAAMRGNGFVPGFSQSLAVVGKLRFTANDVLSVKVTYTQPGGFLGFILSFFDGPNKIQSRLDLTFIGC